MPRTSAWLGVEVDLLEVRDRLAELPELVEDELAPDRVAGDGLLAQSERLEKLEVEALDVVDAPTLAPVEVAAFSSTARAVGPVAARGEQGWRRPRELRRSGAVDETGHVAEDPDDGLDLRAVEEPIETLDDVRDVAAPQLLD